MVPPGYSIRLMHPADYERIGEICQPVYPHEPPYTPAELAEHRAVFPQGQFVAEHVPTIMASLMRFPTPPVGLVAAERL
ncbi:MAG: hypothetical protein ACK54F_10390 [Planctomycetia bacterium]